MHEIILLFRVGNIIVQNTLFCKEVREKSVNKNLSVLYGRLYTLTKMAV
jgi:hypothetical protein